MKRSLLLYLLIISALMNIFIYMYFSRKDEAATGQGEPVRTQSNDSLQVAMNALTDANYFTLAQNQNAQNYFASGSIQINSGYEQFAEKVSNALLDLNNRSEGNPYTGQSKLGDRNFIINKVRVLNHRWIIADYSDGQYWGEVLLKYFPNQDGTFSFEVIQSLIYAQ